MDIAFVVCDHCVSEQWEGVGIQMNTTTRCDWVISTAGLACRVDGINSLRRCAVTGPICRQYP